MGGKGSGRRSARIERRAIKLEAMAIDHALQTYESGSDRDKFELTKAIVPKIILCERNKEPERRQITIEFVKRADLLPEPKIITPEPEPLESTPTPVMIPFNASSLPLPIAAFNRQKPKTRTHELRNSISQ